jgi:hypothetical protein
MQRTTLGRSAQPVQVSRVVHHRRFVTGALLMLSTLMLATDQLLLAVVTLAVGIVLVASSYEHPGESAPVSPWERWRR